MSMWDWDEQGESSPPKDRQQYHRAHQSYSDHRHHHHDHVGYNHNHHHHRHGHDNVHSNHDQRSLGASPSNYNYGTRHEIYGGLEFDGEEDIGRQNYGQHDSNEHEGHEHNTYESPTHTLDMSHGPVGYETQEEHQTSPPPNSRHGHEASNQSDLFTSDSVVNLNLDEIDALARTHRSHAWLVVLYAPWCRFCQVMEPNFKRVAQHLENSNVYVGRFRADGDYKEYAKRYLQLEHFPTILFFPKDSSNIVKYHSENREVDALLGFVQAFE